MKKKIKKKQAVTNPENDIESVTFNPFSEENEIIGTRMEIQLSGVVADLLLKLHDILPYASNQIVERHLTLLEGYFEPYLSDAEKKAIAALDAEASKQIERFHPLDRGRAAIRIYNDYIEKKMKILMTCAYNQDLLPGRIRTMNPL